MADKQQQKVRPLKPLLKSVYEVHRKDIKTYTSGHLNPGKLLKREQERHLPWDSSKWTPMRSKPAVKQVDDLETTQNDHKTMQDALIEFSLGPVGSMTVGLEASSSVIKQEEDPESQESAQPPIRPTVHIEELHLPEIMVPVAQREVEGKKGQPFKKTFVQSYLNQSTKADQFASFKDFENKVIQLSDANDKGVLTGEKTVKRLQNKLAKKLNTLDSMSQRGPNFHKLQIYTDVWQEIISNSDLFGDILQKIKDEYDAYMTYLLDTQRPSQHRLLYNHLESLAQDQSVTDKLKKEQQRVALLEEEALALLEENERLKLELEDEENRARYSTALGEVDDNAQARVQISMEEVPKDLEEQVNDLHVQIMEKLEEMKAIKQKQRAESVPISVCHHLEQCIKETEVDVQKLIKQNEFLEQSIEELERELEELIEKTQTDESAARKLWRKINAVDVIKMAANKALKKKA